MSNQDHTSTITRKFGVEFEFVQKRSGQAVRADVVSGLLSKELNAVEESWNHRTRRHWKVTTDASIGYENGELVSPILNGEAGLAEMDKALDAASDVAKVNADCGFHCHVDVRDLSVPELKRVVKLWILCEDSIDCLLSPSRRGGCQWCKSSTEGAAPDRNVQNKSWFAKIDACETKADVAAVFGASSHDRYQKLNLRNIAGRGSIEVRCHQGTLNREKAEKWVRLCVALVEAARQWKHIPPRSSGKDGRERLASVLTYLGVQGATRKFFLKRARQLSR